MYQELKKLVCQANLRLKEEGLVVLTWGNVSAITPDRQLVIIKPSGVDYATMGPEDMVVVRLEDGEVVEGNLRPSSDLPTHLELYRAFPDVQGVVHTHSVCATALAQAERDLPCYGTTHADYFYGPVPCTRPLRAEEIQEAYEVNTGKVIVETFQKRGVDPLGTPGVLVSKHGPFTWGRDPMKAVENALVLENIAHMALMTESFAPGVQPAPQHLMDKHYFRKHGPGAYYGQK